uniref:HD_domain domain-containing protein n=1 Tax=Haemonchus contortus TaxID=6289 RepID=A0A7I5E7L1_HAECO
MVRVDEIEAAKQAKAGMESKWSKTVKELSKLFRHHCKNASSLEKLLTVITGTLTERGIENEEDWKNYVATMERDGKIVSDIEEILNVNTLHTKVCVTDPLKHGMGKKVAGMREPRAQGSLSHDHARRDDRLLHENRHST